MKILNGHAGVGGNRKLWGEEHEITAIELNPKIAAIYQKLFKNDTILVTDLEDYLLKHFREFDFIWLSPPCPNNSKARYWYSKNSIKCMPKLPDLRLYQYKIFLEKFFDGLFVIENVVPYYEFLIKPSIILGHNAFWSNFNITQTDVPELKKLFKRNTLDEVKALKDWLGFDFPEIVYLETHSPTQFLRNCVHPETGLHILNCALNKSQYLKTQQLSLFDGIYTT